MSTLEKLIEILKKSIKKNGEKPLTNKYLLALLKIVEEEEIEEEEQDMMDFDPNWD